MDTAAIATGAPAPDSTDDASGATTADRRPLVLAVVLLALAAGPLLIAILQLWGQPYFPAGDQAVIELRVRDVGPHTPLLGPYSRYYWNHPGPLIYVLLAVPYRVLGSRSTALLAASGILNLTCIIGIAAVAWRRGKLALTALTMGLLAVLMHYITPSELTNPWNPFLTLLPVALFVFLAWTTVEGDRWALVATLFVGSFLVESHVGYAPLVAGVGAWVIAMLASERWRRSRAGADASGEVDEAHAAGAVDRATGVNGSRRLRFLGGSSAPRWRTVVLVSSGMLVVVWAPVLIDQLAGSGNLATVISYFASSDRTPVGFGRALDFMAREFGNRAPWMGGIEPVDPGSGAVVTRELSALLAPTAAFGLAALAAWRTGARAALRFQAVIAVAAAMCFLSLARITDTVFNYLIHWTWVVAMLVWLGALWSLWCAARLWNPRPSDRAYAIVEWVRRRVHTAWARRLAPLAGAVALLVIGYNSVGLHLPLPEGWSSSTMEYLSPRVVDGVPAGGVIRVRGMGGFVNSQTDGLALQLEKAGHQVIVEPVDDYKFGPHRTTQVEPSTVTMWVIYADLIDEWAPRTDMTEIARYDPLTPAEREQFRRDDELLLRQFQALQRDDLVKQLRTNDSVFLARDLPGVDQAALKRFDELRLRGTPVAVFLTGPS